MSVTVFSLSSCGEMSPEEHYIKEAIPIQIQRSKPITVKIRVSGNGVNDVGIRCSPQVWNVLLRSKHVIEVSLKSTDQDAVTIAEIDPGSGGTAFIAALPNVHYLFYIYGRPNASATVEISFLNAPPEPTDQKSLSARHRQTT